MQSHRYRADLAQEEINGLLRKNEESYHGLRSRFDKMDKKVDRVEGYLLGINRAVQFIYKGQDSPDTESRPQIKRQKTQQPLAPNSTFFCLAQNRAKTSPNLLDFQKSDTVIETLSKVGVHVNHTAATHRILGWRCVRDLFADKAPETNYIMDNEKRKGLLRSYGKGLGREIYDELPKKISSGSASSPCSGDPDQYASSASSDDPTWRGYDLGFPNIVDGKFFYDEKDHLGGLTAQGTLKLDRNTMMKLLRSYFMNIHILHPFLDTVHLGHMVDKVCGNLNNHSLGKSAMLIASNS